MIKEIYHSATPIHQREHKIDIGGREIEVLHTPGHSPGHMCFWEKSKEYLFTGDLIYKDILSSNMIPVNMRSYYRNGFIGKFQHFLIDVANAKPRINKHALQKADVSIYADSMQSLVYKDIQNSLAEIEKL